MSGTLPATFNTQEGKVIRANELTRRWLVHNSEWDTNRIGGVWAQSESEAIGKAMVRWGTKGTYTAIISTEGESNHA
jgi:hypothetical protein